MGGSEKGAGRGEIDLVALSGAISMKRAGWADAEIVATLGPGLPMDMRFEDAVLHNAKIPRPNRRIDLDEEGSFYGDP